MRGVVWTFDALLSATVFATASMAVATSSADAPPVTAGVAVGRGGFVVGVSIFLLVLDWPFPAMLLRPDPIFVRNCHSGLH